MTALYWLIRKDIKRFLSDRNGAVLAVMMPVVLASLLGLIFAPSDGSVEIDILVVDQDQTPESAALVKAMMSSDALKIEGVSLSTAQRRLKRGEASVAVVLPEGTSAALQGAALFGGQRQTARLLYDPSKATEAAIAEGQLYRVTMEQVAKTLTDPAQLKKMMGDLRRLQSLVAGGDARLRRFLDAGVAWAEGQPPAVVTASGEPQAGAALQPPLALQKERVTAAGPAAGFNTFAHNFAGMLCMFLMFWAIDAGKELVVEREAGAQTRLMLAPITRWHIFLGRGISTILVALAISAAVYLIGMTVFDIRILGSWPGFLLVLLGQAIFVGGLALLLAGLLPTERQINSVGAFVVLILSFTGGAMFPSFLMPDWIQSVAFMLPTYWATDGLAAMSWRGLPFTAALPSSGVTALSGLVCGLVGARAYRWKV